MEIRMGSPYNMCHIQFSGTDLKLPEGNWQDLYAWSKDNQFLALVQWDFKDNEPGFHFLIIDTKSDTLIKSQRIFGMVNKLKISDGSIHYNKFLLDREKSERGKLCCNTEEVFEIKN